MDDVVALGERHGCMRRYRHQGRLAAAALDLERQRDARTSR